MKFLKERAKSDSFFEKQVNTGKPFKSEEEGRRKKIQVQLSPNTWASLTIVGSQLRVAATTSAPIQTPRPARLRAIPHGCTFSQFKSHSYYSV